MSGKLPRGWARATIGDVTIGKVEQREPSGRGNFPYIDIGSVDNQAKRITEAKQIPVTKAPSRARQLVASDDVLVSMTRPNLNAVAMVPPSLEGATASTGFDVLRSNGAIAPAWLFLLVRSRDFVEELSSLVQGALYPAVRSTDIRDYEFLLPPLPEQRRIVTRLEKLEARSRKARAALDTIPPLLAQARQSLLAAAFNGDLTADWRRKHSVNFSKSWHRLPLRDLVADLTQGWSPKCDSQPSPSPAIWGVIKTTSIQAMQFDGVENKCLPRHFKPRPELEIAVGDVLITRKGPRIRSGVAALVREVRPRLMICDTVFRLRCNSDKVTPEFLELVLNEPTMAGLIDRIKGGISESGVGITQNRFLSLLTKIPSPPEQAEIVRRLKRAVSRLDPIAKAYAAVIADLDRLDQSLLAKAFCGDLVKQNPADEPAAKLLERISVARATVEKS